MPQHSRGGTAYYVGEDPTEHLQAATDIMEAVHITAESHGSRDVRYEGTSPSKPDGHPTVGAIHTSRDTEAAADSPELQADLTETAIDFGFATQGPSADTPRSHRRLAHRPVKAVAKSLVRSGLRCPKCHLRSWICLCDRAPVEIDRRGKASGHQGRYMHPCLFSKHCATRPAHVHTLRPGNPSKACEADASPCHVVQFSLAHCLCRQVCEGQTLGLRQAALLVAPGPLSLD